MNPVHLLSYTAMHTKSQIEAIMGLNVHEKKRRRCWSLELDVCRPTVGARSVDDKEIHTTDHPVHYSGISSEEGTDPLCIQGC